MAVAAALCASGLTVTVRPPSDPELPACRMLLPEVVRQRMPAEFFLALTDHPFRIAGAAASTAVVRRGAPVLRVTLRVIKPFRRRGIGSQLVDRLAAAARSRAIDKLVVWNSPQDEPEACSFLRAKDFVCEDRFTTFETEIQPYVQIVQAIRERLVARRKIPARVRLVSLAEAPHDQVATMQAEYLAGTPEGDASCLQQAATRESLTQASVVLMIDGRVEGVLLAEKDGPTVKVESKVVANGYRGGFANVLLMAAGAEKFLACGAQRVRFISSGRVHDTLKLARRCAARGVKVAELYTLDLVAG